MNTFDKMRTCATAYIRLAGKERQEKKEKPLEMQDEMILLNTEVGSDNLGDAIIMFYSKRVVTELFPERLFTEIASHIPAKEAQIRDMKSARAVIVCGTNFLSPRLELHSVWAYEEEMRKIPNMVLMAVGMGYYGKISPYTRMFYKRLLKNGFRHSVRDDYTKKSLEELGISGVLNTNCVTLWDIEPCCEKIPQVKADKVVFTVTGYKDDPEHDRILLEILRRNYNELYFWPQGDTDLQYLQAHFDTSGIIVLERTMEAFNDCLRGSVIDYVGSRLHGGIHAMHYGRRTIILAVDNRAREISRDTGLPVVEMSEISEKLEKRICDAWKTEIHLNHAAIDEWKQELLRKLT